MMENLWDQIKVIPFHAMGNHEVGKLPTPAHGDGWRVFTTEQWGKLKKLIDKYEETVKILDAELKQIHKAGLREEKG